MSEYKSFDEYWDRNVKTGILSFLISTTILLSFVLYLAISKTFFHKIKTDNEIIYTTEMQTCLDIARALNKKCED